MSPLDVMSLFGPMFVIVPTLLWLLVIGPLVLYPVARWRAARDPYPDTQLGLKVALHYFRTLALQTLLLGGMLLIYAIISKSSADKGGFYRVAFGLLVPGAIVFGAHTVLLRRTNDEHLLGVRRLFLGYSLLVTGLLGFLALVMGFQALFAKGSSGDAGRLFLAATLIYCSAWAALGMLFSRMVGILPPSASSGPPHDVVVPPPGAPVAPPPAPATPGLPSLGTAYPPIEPKS